MPCRVANIITVAGVLVYRRRGSRRFAKPKSSTFTWPAVVRKRLAGLISRCTTPMACAASSALARADRDLDQLRGRETALRQTFVERLRR